MARSHTDHDQCPTARPKIEASERAEPRGGPTRGRRSRPLAPPAPTGSGTSRGAGVASSGLLTTVVSCQRHKSTVASAR